MKVYTLKARIMNPDFNNDETLAGVFSSLDKALEAVRGLKGKDGYEGEYSEDLEDEDWVTCKYEDTEDMYGTYFTIDPWEIDEFDENIII